jgi:uncharacterized membrane protein
VTPTRRAVLLTLPLALLGLGVSVYLTYEHYSTSATLACPDNGSINCVKVTSSSYSELAGVPVALLGLVYYVGVVALCLPVAWRAASPWVSRLRIASLAGGVGFVVYLVWAELFRIDAICLWCTVVHVSTVVLFAIVVLLAALAPPAASAQPTQPTQPTATAPARRGSPAA